MSRERFRHSPRRARRRSNWPVCMTARPTTCAPSSTQVGLKAASTHARLERLEDEPDAVLAGGTDARRRDRDRAVGPDARKRFRGRRPRRRGSSRPASGCARRASASATTTTRSSSARSTSGAGSSASGLDLELDVGWLRVAGHDPVAELEAHAGRLLLVHAKDVRPDGDGWLDVVAGDGELDFKAIARRRARRRRQPPRGRTRHAVRRPRRRRAPLARHAARGHRMTDVNVGLVGCGKISGIYLDNAPRLDGVQIRGLHGRRHGACAGGGTRPRSACAFQRGAGRATRTSRSCSA